MDQLARRHDDARLAAHRTLAEQALEFAKAADALRTREAYDYQWQVFADWCALNGHASLPCEPGTLILYITACAKGEVRPPREDREWKPWAASSIALALTAINQRHVRIGHAPPRSHPHVRLTFKGICNTLGKAPTQKTPVLGETLSRMVEVLPDTLIGVRDRALLLVGFLGAFRRSELVALKVSDLTFCDEDGLDVLLRKSKTDQQKQGRVVSLVKQVDEDVCPMRAMKAWLERAGITEGLIFRSVDRHGNVGKSLSDKEVALIVKRTASAAGIKSVENLAGHSLRAGLVTSAAKRGERATSIMKQTGHTSVEMVSRYIREAKRFQDNVTRGMLKSARRAAQDSAMGGQS
jgi:integrase